ncbi:glycosyltransferase [Nostoc mirabile]|uniref:glycosyltransferase n=1 Tax=Nostoc mirabile TaxID=2907820 RepID=UPI0027E15334|nr:glycosyltransferase [Nostoc mirabile]
MNEKLKIVIKLSSIYTKFMRYKALIFFPHNPYPGKTGAHQRCLSMLKGLKELGYDVTLFGSNLITDNPWQIDIIQDLQIDLDINVEVYQGTEADWQFMSSVSANIEGTNWDFYTPPGLCQRFREMFRQLAPDVVVINYAFWAKLAIGDEFKSAVRIIETHDLLTLSNQMRQALGQYLRTPPYTSDEIDSELVDEDFFSKLHLNATPDEYLIYDQYDYTIAIAPREQQLIREHTCQTRVEYVPMTFITENVDNTYTNAPLLAIGPNPFNIQGYLYFTTKVLPLVLHQLPEFCLKVVGSSCQHLIPVESTELLGFIPDLKPLYTESRFAVCPLIGGTGQQVKIVEAMAHGLPVITLRNVAESSPIEHGVNGFIADNAEEFAAYTIQLFNNPDLCRQIGQVARQTIATNFSSQTLVEKLNFLLPENLKNLQKVTQKLSFKIVVDAVFFQLYQTGISRVWKSLLEEWANNGFAKHIVVLDRAGTAPKIPGIRYRNLLPYDYNDTLADKEILQQVCDEEGANLFISSYYTIPTTTPSVFMAYDMIPEVMGWDMNNPMWQEKHHGIEYASAYIAISQHTAHDLVKYFTDIIIESITVAHCGVKSTFSPCKLQEVNAFKSKYSITKPYFILVGVGSAYKNSILFFQALSKLASSYGFDIVCTGSGGLLAPEFRAYTSGSIVYMLQLSDEELAIAYSGAVALVYPSKYEGFGMPVIEAMACGCPVITCPNASIPEVAGEAAIYVDHSNIDELTNALCDVQKPNIRNSLITAGLAQARKFSWSKMAQTVSSALINATLLSLNLKEMNLIIFPDWSQPEDLIGLELQRVMRALTTHISSEKTTLLINTGNIGGEDAELFLSSVAMNLLVEEDLDVTEGLEISLVGKLADIQWEALLPSIHARIILQHEDQQAITQVQAEKLPSRQLDSLSNQLYVLQ